MTDEPDQCVILRRVEGTDHVDISFPFFEDMQVIRFKISEALNLRNAIDDLVRPLLLETPKGVGEE